MELTSGMVIKAIAYDGLNLVEAMKTYDFLKDKVDTGEYMDVDNKINKVEVKSVERRQIGGKWEIEYIGVII